MSIPFARFRLKETDLFPINALAASNGGNSTTAVKEMAHQWHALVFEAGVQNAALVTPAEWELLGRLMDPEPLGVDPTAAMYSRDWSAHLAAELLEASSDRGAVLGDLLTQEADATRALAAKVSAMGRARGYALMCVLRYFWRVSGESLLACVDPGVWMVPLEREGVK